MPFYRAQTIFNRTTSDPADAQTNTTFWESDDPGGGSPADIAVLLAAGYHEIDGLMPDHLFTGTADIKIYDMSDTEPRFPVLEDQLTLTLSSVTATLPPEVSMVLSFHGDFESGVNRARRRGRIYLPTFVSMSESGTGNVRFSPAQQAAAESLFGVWKDNIIGGLNWAVFSPTTFAQTADLATSFNDVTGGWVDSAADIQRRRGEAGAPTRLVFT